MYSILDPKVDFVFKNIFGSEKNSDILISFLNAVIKSKNPIVKVKIENGDINQEYFKDKYSRLDIRATTSNNEHINIEIQLKNEYNMIKRTLYYWGKIYTEKLSQSENYRELKRTICINILDFKYINNDKFHNVYRLKEVNTNEELTDVEEIHFIELPKLNEFKDNDMLIAWIEFLKNPNDMKVRELEFSINEIKRAKDELIKISNDSKQREIYDAIQKTIMDNNSALDESKVRIAKRLLDILKDEEIASRVDLKIEDVKMFRKEKEEMEK